MLKKSLAAGGMYLLMSANAAPSLADNTAVEEAIHNRPDLSSFYQALVTTGVAHELTPGGSYTVFAPTNEAFAALTREQYPCFYAQECRAQVATILRNHIAPGEVYVSDVARQQGGIYSIDHHFISVGELNHDDYTVNGNNITYTTWLGGGGILYKIDGVIATPQELADLEQYPVAERTITVARTIPDPACGIGGCADEVTQTTVTRTVTGLESAR